MFMLTQLKKQGYLAPILPEAVSSRTDTLLLNTVLQSPTTVPDIQKHLLNKDERFSN